MKAPWWVLASAGAALLLSLLPLAERHRAESRNKALGIAVEGPVLQELAAHAGLSFDQAIIEFKQAGASGVSLSDEALSELVVRGQADLKPQPGGVLITAQAATLDRIQARVQAEWPGLIRKTGEGLLFEGPPQAAPGLNIGLDPALAQAARKAGLEVIARHLNFPGSSAVRTSAILRLSQEMGANWYLPLGDQVLGWRGSEKETAANLQQLGIRYLAAEFVKTAGDTAIKTAIPTETVRLHTVQALESDRISPRALLERYGKAFRERNVRWLLVRPVASSSADPFADFLNLVKSVGTQAQKEGASLRVPRPFTDPSPPGWQPLAVALASAPLLAWCAGALLGARKTPWWAWMGSGLLAAFSIASAVSPLLALALAVGYPVAGYLILEAEEESPWLAGLILVGLSLVGGLAVASQHVGVGWMIQNDQFSGIKVGHFLPVAIAGFLMLRRMIPLKKALESPILWGTALLSVVFLGAVAFMLARTGNDNPAGVSGLELQFRAILDRLLYARPRTKEFLIGHPALVVGLALLAWSKVKPSLGPAAAVLLTVGAIGVTSIINTLCHFHTPLELNLARIFIGLAIGGILGGAAVLALKAFRVHEPRPEKAVLG